MKYKTIIKKEDFEDIVVFSVSEPGAMGPNDMMFYKSNGESFSIDYQNEAIGIILTFKSMLI